MQLCDNKLPLLATVIVAYVIKMSLKLENNFPNKF